MNKLTGLVGIIAFIVLASECEFTLTTIVAKAIALAVIAIVAVLANRKPVVVPARRRK